MTLIQARNFKRPVRALQDLTNFKQKPANTIKYKQPVLKPNPEENPKSCPDIQEDYGLFLDLDRDDLVTESKPALTEDNYVFNTTKAYYPVDNNSPCEQLNNIRELNHLYIKLSKNRLKLTPSSNTYSDQRYIALEKEIDFVHNQIHKKISQLTKEKKYSDLTTLIPVIIDGLHNFSTYLSQLGDDFVLKTNVDQHFLPSMKYKVDLEKHKLKSMYRIATISKYFLNNPSYKINSQYPTIIQAVRAKQICLQQPVQHSSIQPKKKKSVRFNENPHVFIVEAVNQSPKSPVRKSNPDQLLTEHTELLDFAVEQFQQKSNRINFLSEVQAIATNSSYVVDFINLMTKDNADLTSLSHTFLDGNSILGMGPSKFDLMTSQLEQQDLESIITLKNIIADKKGSVVRNMLKLDIELDRIISDKIAEQFTHITTLKNKTCSSITTLLELHTNKTDYLIVQGLKKMDTDTLTKLQTIINNSQESVIKRLNIEILKLLTTT